MGQTNVTINRPNLLTCGVHECDRPADAWVTADLQGIRVAVGVCAMHTNEVERLAKQIVGTDL